MWPFHRKLLALCILSAGLVCVPVANADPLMAPGFTVGSQSVTLTSPGFVLGPTIHAGALNLNPPAGVIGYCIDIFQTISFNTLYNDYTPKSLATDGFFTAARKGEIAQLFHGFYDMSLTSSTKSAAFQLALWEIVFETGPKLNVDGANADHGVTYATSPDTPGNVITTANLWLGGLGARSRVEGLVGSAEAARSRSTKRGARTPCPNPRPGPCCWRVLASSPLWCAAG